MSTPTYSVRELYGGAVALELPTDFIDSSDIRQIPDHQEVFLSPSTLMSVIFELNDYVQPLPAGSSSGQQQRQPQTNGALTQDAIDANAAKYHFTDVIAPPDTLTSPLQTPEKIAMHHASLSGFPTYVVAGAIDSVETRSRGPSSSSSSAQNTVYQLQLLVRMKNYATDLCVRINVPMKEIAQDDGEVAAEVGFARELLERVVATLEVRDFGLFGAAA